MFVLSIPSKPKHTIRTQKYLFNDCYFLKALYKTQASLLAQMVKNLSAMRETWVRSLGQEDLLEEGIATHSTILAWGIPME